MNRSYSLVTQKFQKKFPQIIGSPQQKEAMWLQTVINELERLPSNRLPRNGGR